VKDSPRVAERAAPFRAQEDPTGPQQWCEWRLPVQALPLKGEGAEPADIPAARLEEGLVITGREPHR
jgi:hypothetical protein